MPGCSEYIGLAAPLITFGGLGGQTTTGVGGPLAIATRRGAVVVCTEEIPRDTAEGVPMVVVLRGGVASGRGGVASGRGGFTVMGLPATAKERVDSRVQASAEPLCGLRAPALSACEPRACGEPRACACACEPLGAWKLPAGKAQAPGESAAAAARGQCEGSTSRSSWCSTSLVRSMASPSVQAGSLVAGRAPTLIWAVPRSASSVTRPATWPICAMSASSWSARPSAA
mmetsp:Transcript_61675/g.133639  ORF Transcript_61675/g.133639 Transcript_61675/m.133639 type:complete len:229 (-) Transcript_61675:758-1444(-)